MITKKNEGEVSKKMKKNAVSLAALHTHTHSQFIKENKKNEYIKQETYKTQ